MAKKNDDMESKKKSKKQTVKTVVMPAVEPAQIKATATRKPAANLKPTTTSRTRKTASDEPQKVEDKKFVVYGVVLHSDSTPAQGMTVIAYDKDVSGENLLGESTTGAKGSYRIVYSAAQFRLSKNESGGADIFVRIHGVNDVLLFQSKTVRNAPTDLHMDVKLPAAQFVVRGQVRLADGKPVVGALVRAFDRDMRKPQLLGTATTDTTGHYEILYRHEQFSHAERGTAELIVRAFDNNSTDKPLAESQVRINAGNDATINLIVPAFESAASEWERIRDMVLPLLEGQGEDDQPLPPWELNDSDIDFIVAEASLDRDSLRDWAWARRAALDRPLLASAAAGRTSPELLRNASGGFTPGSLATQDHLSDWQFYYACARELQTRKIEDIFARATDELLNAVRRAAASNVVPSQLLTYLKPLRAALERARADAALTPAEPGQPARIGDVLDVVAPQWLDVSQRRKVVDLVARVDPAAADFEQHARAIGLEAADALVLTRTLRLAKLADNHLPMIAALHPLLAEDGDESLCGLTRLDSARWLDLAYQHGAPANVASTPEVFALRLRDAAELAAPEPALRARLDDGSVAIKGAGFSSLRRFLTNNPKFSFADDDAEDAVATADMSGIEESAADVGGALRQMQSLKRASVRWEEAPLFVGAGLGSIEALAQHGTAGLKKLLGNQLDTGRIEAIAQTAITMKMTGVGMLSQILPLMRNAGTDVMQTKRLDSSTQKIVDASPSLRRLFGALEQCACDPCQSVLSPSAYLVDLLNFVGRDNGVSWHLQQRRADIYDLELSCDNAQIELPHIDLVNEILENSIALPFAISLPGVVDIAARMKQRPLPATVFDALQATTWEPLVESSLFVEIGPKSREGITYAVVSDRYRRWTLELSDGYFGFAGSDEQLQSVDPKKVIEVIEALDGGQPPPDVDGRISNYFADHAVGIGNLPALASDIQVTPIEAGRRWQVSFTASGRVEIDDQTRLLTLSADLDGAQQSHEFSNAALQATRRALDVPQLGGMLLSNVHDAGNYTIQSLAQSTWHYSKGFVSVLINIPAGVVLKSLSYQCTARDRDLASRPQHRNPRAYREFLARADAVYPWTLPFDVDLIETRSLLGTAGLARAELMCMALPPGAVARRVQYAIESLGMTRAELTLATTAAPADGVWKRWGLNVAGGSATVFDSFDERRKSGTPLELLSTVSIVLQQARLSFVELQWLLQSEFINPGIAVGITVPIDTDSAGECDPTQLQLNRNSPELLDRLHRFLRWQRRLKWSMPELDFALRELQKRGFDADRLVEALADVEALRARLRIPVDTLLTAFYGFDRVSYSERQGNSTRVIEPLYERTFQNPHTAMAGGADATRSPDTALAYAALAAAGSTITIGDRAAVVAASVGLYAHDVLPLLNADYLLAGAAAADAATRLEPDHLQMLLRAAVLARALHVSPTRLAVLFDVVGQRPFEAPRALREFCEALDFLAEVNADVDRLRYVLTHRGPESYAWVLTEDRGQRTLSALQLSLRATAAQPDEPAAAATIAPAQLATLLNNATTQAQRLATLRDLTQLESWQLERVVLSLWPAFDDAFTTEARVRELVDVAVAWQRRSAVVVANLAQATGIDAPLVDNLLWYHLRAPGNAAAMELFADTKPRASAQRFEDESRVFDAATIAAHPEFQALLKLHKFGLLNDSWRLTPTDLARFPGSALNSRALDGLSIDALPVAAASGQFVNWRRSAALLDLCHASRGLATVLDDYARAIAPPAVDPVVTGAAVWSAALDLPADSVRGFVGAGVLEFGAIQSALQDCRDPLRVVAWYELMVRTRRFALGAADVKLLSGEAPGKPGIDVAVRALQARFGEPQWREVMAKAGNALRIVQRDRLVDYLLWRDGLRDENALYERYLIDVQMAPCMNTTRLLQAIAAVQLFVQRCLMNLEINVDPAAVDPDRQWEWRKNYRVWEANRKIFLFPENWLYPELRDDKSELYRGFESALMQAEASDVNAANAVQGYLESLVDVAQISVMGMYEESPRTSTTFGIASNLHKTLHVVGRSPDPPYTYFYRSNERNGEVGSRWTPWERISLDLPSCHVVLFMLGGEQHLVWPILELEKDAQANKEYYNIKLAWARRTALGWTQRKVATESATRIEKHFKRDERGSLALKLSESQSGPRCAAVELYVARKTPSTIDEATLDANTLASTYEPGSASTYTIEISDWTFKATAYVKYRDTGRVVPLTGCQFTIIGVRHTVPADPVNGEGIYHFGVHGGTNPSRIPAAASGFPADGTPVDLAIHNDDGGVIFEGKATIDGAVQTVATGAALLVNSTRHHGTGSFTANLLFSQVKDPDFDDPAINEFARVKMDRAGSFWFETGRDTRWIVDSVHSTLQLPAETLSWESRFRERDNYVNYALAGLHDTGGRSVFPLSQFGSNYVALRAARATGAAGADTWYWEENASGTTSRFLSLLGVANAGTLVTLQPGCFEEAREYRYRYSAGREQLFALEAQSTPANTRFGVNALSSYFPAGVPTGVDPRNIPLLQFHLGMPYASYNWEVFYHLPMGVARFLASQQRFEEAQRWLACVFDPTTNDAATGRERYWRCLPLRHSNTPLSIQQLMQALADPEADPAVKQTVQDQVAASIANPFSPFAIARERNSAYEWYTVTAYVGNLIEWGDSLYRRDTRESINEAALLYVFAANILGRRPEVVPKQGFQPPLSYRALGGRWDDFGNAWARLIDTPLGKLLLELLLAFQRMGGINPHAWDQQIQDLASVGALYFCIPKNDKLLELWDTVADRLWKIRHCQNLDGVQRPLALLDPPIDPELLIRARLAGVDIADVLADLHAPPPNYRYSFLVQKALEFCAELKSLGAALLAAIEKKDGEKLALLRSTQEIAMLGLIEAVRLDQVSEADANIVALQQSRLNVLVRYRYLQRMLGNAEIRFDALGVPVMDQHGGLQVRDANAPGGFRGLGLVQSEVDQVARMQDAHTATMVAGALKAGAGIGLAGAAVLYAYGVVSKPAADAAKAVAEGVSALGEVSALIATDADHSSRVSGLVASFQRRREDWIQQSVAAVDEFRQIDKKIIAAQVSQKIALKELTNHRRSLENAREIDDYLRQRKFSSAELYSWMETQLLAAHHAAYQLAFDLAKRVERAWRRELGESESHWIRYGYWDGAKKGLQAGEQLHLDLNRMQFAWIERSKREFEVTKHVSLLTLDPAALVALRDAGSCTVSLPEVLFDLDFPGHYFRRLKTVSVSIPCVTGPYGGVHCTLKLLKSSVRTRSSPRIGYARVAEDERFEDSLAGVESVVTSSGQNDSGLFETNLRDERFLPFEGSGAISTWQFSLPDEFRAFDYDTIADVILHVRYTARNGGDSLRSEALDNLQDALNAVAQTGSQQGLTRLFSLKQEFPGEWYKLTHSAGGAAGSSAELAISKSRFPFLFSARQVSISIGIAELYLVPTPNNTNRDFPTALQLFVPGEANPVDWADQAVQSVSIEHLPGKRFATNVAVTANEEAGKWRLEVPADDVAALRDGAADLLLMCRYALSM